MSSRRSRPDRLPEIGETERVALRAVYRGHASSGQQKIAMVTIMQDILGLTALPSGSASEYEAGFAAGKQHAGMVIASLADLRLWTPEAESDHDH